MSDAEDALHAAEVELGESAPFALQLLSQLYTATERREKSSEALRQALHLNPFLWDAFAQLCHAGEKVDPFSIFQLHWECPPPAPQEASTLTVISNSVKATPANTAAAVAVGGTGGITPDSVAGARRLRSVFGGHTSSPFSPSFGILPLEESPIALYTPTLTDANEQKALPKLVHSLRAHVGQLKEAVFPPVPRQAHIGPTPHVRRSSRLFSNSYSVKENNKSPNRKFAAPKSPSKKCKQRIAKVLTKANIGDVMDCNNTNNRENNNMDRNPPSFSAIPPQTAVSSKVISSEGLMTLLRTVGHAYAKLAGLECRHALELLEELPPQQYRSPWVRTLVALAHHELGEYESAARNFAEVRASHPLRVEHLDTYSTCLWHLQREVELSALARELVARDRKCATAWLVAGNCFSLHKEHDTAVKFFRRAVQLRPDRPYAHTLLGHEYVATEETDKAMACFRSAVRLDPRHYNAWFGIATVYSKQERFRLAEVHFRRALTIHPESGVLRCHLGVVLVALGRSKHALDTLDHAVRVDPKNPLCRFHRASVLFSAGRLKEALEELEDLKDLVPKESLVYYLLGKVHNKLGNAHLALMHFSWATDLDPKGASGHIKEAFDPARAEDPTDPAL